VAELQAQREVWASTLVELAERYPKLIVLDGDLANSTRAEVFEAAYPDRFLEMGIAEQNMMGVAAGLATLGFVPWLSSFAVFLAKRSLDQLRQVVAQPNLNVKLAGHYSGLMTARTGKTHQSVEDIAVMRAMPHMNVVVPADGVETRQAIRAIMADSSPTYLRLIRDPLPNVFGDDYRFELGKATVVRDGRDVTIITTGAQLLRALDGAEELSRSGIEAHVLHVPTIKPLDEDAIIAAADRTGFVVTTEEHSIIGGLGGAVAEVLGERRPTLMKRNGLQDVYGESGSNEDLLEKYGLTGRHVADACRSLIASGRPDRAPASR
jgi:transketolase